MDFGRKLRLERVRVAEHGGAVIVKRGLVEMHIGGPRARELVMAVLDAVSSGERNGDQIIDEFAAPDQGSVRALLAELYVRRLAAYANDPEDAADGIESPADVFYWHVGHPSTVRRRLAETRLVIIGVNGITLRLLESLHAAGVHPAAVLDHPLLRNPAITNAHLLPLAIYPADYHAWTHENAVHPTCCVVVASEFGGITVLREWNERAVNAGAHFFPILLRDVAGQVGPVVVPGETACAECLWARERSTGGGPTAAFAHDEVQTAVGFHPSMAAILGDLAAIELSKFYGGIPVARAGWVLTVDLLQPSLETRRVLRVPRCPVCSELNRRPPFAEGDSAFVDRLRREPTTHA